MVIALLLSLMDFLVALVVLLDQAGVLHSWRALFSAGAYLLGKGLLFQGSVLSIIDMACGVYVLLMILGVHSVVSYVVFGYLLYKVLIAIVLSR
jgi:hypothetical protein